MDTVKVVQLIETTLTRRGDGTKEEPIRIVKQFWTFDGELVAEVDPAKIEPPKISVVDKKLSFVAGGIKL